MEKYASFEEVQELWGKASLIQQESLAKADPTAAAVKLFHEYEGIPLLPRMDGVVQDLKTWEVRKDDVYILTYPKAGTTWVQEIASAVMHDGNLEEVNKRFTEFRVPFLEMNLPEPILRAKGIPQSHRLLEEIPSPRVIKSHLPGQLLPPQMWDKKPKIIYVIRNPKDLTVSFFHFMRMMVPLPPTLALPFEEFFDRMMTGKVLYGSWWDHYLYFWKKRHDENVLFLRFEDMKRDLRGNVEKISKFLGKNFSDETLDAITDHCTFANMKKNPMANLETIYAKRQKPEGAAFMRKGKVGDWKSHFTVAQNETFDAFVTEKLRGTGLTFEYN